MYGIWEEHCNLHFKLIGYPERFNMFLKLLLQEKGLVKEIYGSIIYILFQNNGNENIKLVISPMEFTFTYVIFKN